MWEKTIRKKKIAREREKKKEKFDHIINPLEKERRKSRKLRRQFQIIV